MGLRLIKIERWMDKLNGKFKSRKYLKKIRNRKIRRVAKDKIPEPDKYDTYEY